MLTTMIGEEKRGRTAWLTLDRPQKLNAMPPSFWGDLRRAVAAAEADPQIRVIVLRGAGRCFSVGGDIDAFGELADISERRAYMRDALSAFEAVERLQKPTIAAVHGQALGGGCELTFVCDIVIADRTATFGTPESAVGLVPGAGVVRGRDHLNLHWLKYMVLTGLPLSADEACVAGLVNKVVPPGEHLAEAERLADVIATRSPLALAVGKTLLCAADAGYGRVGEAIALLQGSKDHAEGLTAFAERREPVFEGS
jgi:enoyl-CoA hydratase/carnithine racemase